MKVLITGVTGFVGGHIVRQALEAGHEVVAVGRNMTALKAYKSSLPLHLQKNLIIEASELDKKNQERLAQIMAENQIQAIIHAAGQASVGQSYKEIESQEQSYKADPRKVVQTTPTGESNIGSTEVLLDALQQSPATAKHFHLVSTGDVFSQTRNTVIDESSIREPNTPYGWTKQIAEERLRQFVSDKDMTGSVSYGPLIFGPGQRTIAMVPIVTDQLLKGKTAVLRGNPDKETDAIDVRDFSSIVLAATEQGIKQSKSTIKGYVVSGHRITIRNVFDAIIKGIKKTRTDLKPSYTVAPEYESASDKPVSDKSAQASFPDVYTNLKSLDDTIQDTVETMVSTQAVPASPVVKSGMFANTSTKATVEVTENKMVHN